MSDELLLGIFLLEVFQMKRYPCQVCKEERMFSPRRNKCAKCIRIEREEFERRVNG